tara:strand:- start:336 stop:794 length:459 start_codon:yes stop_codon:yes gene_type:complete
MNIFYLHDNPKVCSQYHVDKHVVKMILETAQLLSTAHWLSGGEGPYRATHKNHPSAIWARSNKSNYRWLCELGMELCKEYTYRYGKIHKTQQHLEWLSTNIPNIPNGKFTQPTLAMPDQYKSDNHIDSYRLYYIKDKSHLHSWKNRKTPEFI